MDEPLVLAARVGKSPVWAHFTRYTTGAICNSCNQFLRCKSSTSSLLAHLRAHHPSKWAPISHFYPMRDHLPGGPNKQRIKEEDTSDDYTPPKPPKVRQKRTAKQNSSLAEHHETSGDVVLATEAFNFEETVAVIPGPSPKKKKKVEVRVSEPLLFMVVHDELPLNIGELGGFRRFVGNFVTDVQLPSTSVLRRMIDSRCQSSTAEVRGILEVVPWYSLSVADWTDLVHGRHFMGVACNFVDNVCSELKSITIAFEELTEDQLVEDLMARIESIVVDWNLNKDQVTSVTVSGTQPVVTSAFQSCFGAEKILLCFAQSLNGIAKKPFEVLPEVHALIDVIKQVTEVLRQDETLQLEDKREGRPFWEMIHGNNTTWRAIFSQFDRFHKHAKRIEMLLSGLVPMPSEEIMQGIKDVVDVLRPLKGVCDEVGLEEHLSASKVIPLVQCLLASLADTWPETAAGLATKELIVEQIKLQHDALEENEIYAMSTLLDPRFKRNYFKNVKARDAATEKLKAITAMDPEEATVESGDDAGIWKFHSKFVGQQQATATHPLSVYLTTKVADLRNTDPLKYFSLNHVDFRPTAERLFVAQATSVPANKVFSEVGCTLNSHWTSLPAVDLRKLFFLSSVFKADI